MFGVTAIGLLATAACSSSSGTAETSSGSSSPGHSSAESSSATTSETSSATSVSVGSSSSANTASSAAESSSVTGSTSASASSSGSGSVTCLPSSSYSTLFTISDASFCAVAVYTADEALSSDPSWGSHGGPLTFVSAATGGGVMLERWTAPSGSSGALTSVTTNVAAGIPSMAYLNSQANDLPFFGWTAISWTGPGTATTGAIDLLASGSVATSYTANGPYWVAGVAGASGASPAGRLLYTALSPLGSPSTDVNGLYAADACSSPSDELGAGTGCAASQLIDAWDEYSGPIALDSAGNAIAVMTSASAGNQEARGYAASQIAPGAPAVTGATLFTLDGYSGSLAALAPTTTAPGLVVFQPFDSTSNYALNVIEQAYTVSGTGVAASGTPSTLLTVPAMQTSGLYFFTDPQNRLWVAVSGASSTTYVVLAPTS